MNKLINYLIKNKYQFYFVSPHFDDAVLSCGALLYYLAKRIKVNVINVFTKGDIPPYTMSARRLLNRCGYKNAKEFYNLREKEDANILTKLGIDFLNLGYTDAVFRKLDNVSAFSSLIAGLIPEIIHTYPLFRMSIARGIISGSDDKLINNLGKELKKIIPKVKSVIFCPGMTGVHTDHTIVNKVCSQIFNKVVYWSDYPYNLTRRNMFTKEFSTLVYSENLSVKKRLILSYKSQMELLFPDGVINQVPEKYAYIKNKNLE